MPPVPSVARSVVYSATLRWGWTSDQRNRRVPASDDSGLNRASSGYDLDVPISTTKTADRREAARTVKAHPEPVGPVTALMLRTPDGDDVGSLAYNDAGAAWLPHPLEGTSAVAYNLGVDIGDQVRQQRSLGVATLVNDLRHSGLPHTEMPWPSLEEYRTVTRRVALLHEHSATVVPDPWNTYAAFWATPLQTARVVILGQDPYPTLGYATGMAFDVDPQPWMTTLPDSLRSIHTALRNEGYSPPDSLEHWAYQGVLLLNTALTGTHKPRAHLPLWRPFIDGVLAHLAARNVVMVAWGREAQKTVARAGAARVVTAPHPAARGRDRTRFHQAGTFTAVNAMLDRPIEWSQRPLAQG